MLPYLPFVLSLTALGRPMVVVEVRHLSMRACSQVRTRHREALRRGRGWRGLSAEAHEELVRVGPVSSSSEGRSRMSRRHGRP